MNKFKKNKNLLIAFAAALILSVFFTWGYGKVKNFASRGAEITTVSFMVNGEYLKAKNPFFIRYGEGYYVEISDLADKLRIDASSDYKIYKADFTIDGKNFSYNFLTHKLKSDLDNVIPSDYPVLGWNGKVYLSTQFMEDYLFCTIADRSESGNTVYLSYADFTERNFDYGWVSDNKYICHALGEIDGYSYTNSKEAFLENYEKGYRVFEIDLKLTSDGDLALIHSWRNNDLESLLGIEREKSENNEALSTEEFKSAKIYGKYTTQLLKDFALLLKDYPDVYIVIDGKYGVEEREETVKEYTEIHDILEEYNPDLLDRMIPQIYYEEMLDDIMDLYDWKSVIYTWYAFDGEEDFNPIKEMEFALANGIEVITMNEAREDELIDRELLLRGLVPYVHTINDAHKADELRKYGIYGFYTDSLLQ